MTSDDETRLRRLRDLQDVLSAEWVADVLVGLSTCPRNRADLLEAVRSAHAANRHHLHDSVLNRTLRRMEHYELVERDRRPTFPYHAVYQLSPAAVGLLDALAPAIAWAGDHAELISCAHHRDHEDGGCEPSEPGGA